MQLRSRNDLIVDGWLFVALVSFVKDALCLMWMALRFNQSFSLPRTVRMSMDLK